MWEWQQQPIDVSKHCHVFDEIMTYFRATIVLFGIQAQRQMSQLIKQFISFQIFIG